MPFVDYSKTIIYKILCNNYIYVGNTTNYTNRKNAHKNNCDNNTKDSNAKVYQMIRANGGWKNCQMIPIELFPCNSSIEARIREEEWRIKLEAEMNDQKAYTDIHGKEYHKNYYEKNKEHLKEKSQNYKNEHYEERKLYSLQYYEANKKKISEKNKEKITCECGKIICKIVMKRHEKTLHHQKYIQTLSSPILCQMILPTGIQT
jgi:hypothetical protein